MITYDQLKSAEPHMIDAATAALAVTFFFLTAPLTSGLCQLQPPYIKDLGNLNHVL